MSRGIARERQVRKVLEEQGWWTARAAGSLGDADIIALKSGRRAQLLEVKSTARGPFHSFGPKDRAELLEAAAKAGADPFLVWWPPRGEMKFISPVHWP